MIRKKPPTQTAEEARDRKREALGIDSPPQPQRADEELWQLAGGPSAGFEGVLARYARRALLSRGTDASDEEWADWTAQQAQEHSVPIGGHRNAETV